MPDKCANCDKPFDDHYPEGKTPHVWCERRLGSFSKYKPASQPQPALFDVLKRSTGYEV